MEQRFTLGSLFDGSGTCPLAARNCGMIPVWASEIEPYPIAVTTKNFPEMKHLGDITKINGAEIEPVDVITFGSPCQDLSIAGARKGLNDGKRSHLFYEAIRIIREMRESTNGKYPRYLLWENVPGSLSSCSGEDFRSVLQAFVDLFTDTVHVPQPNGGGKWTKAGLVMGDNYSICWKVLDAQYFGVPQRRKRLFTLVDTRNGSAGEILFECQSLSRDIKKIIEAEQGFTEDAGNRTAPGD